MLSHTGIGYLLILILVLLILLLLRLMVVPLPKPILVKTAFLLIGLLVIFYMFELLLQVGRNLVK